MSALEPEWRNLGKNLQKSPSTGQQKPQGMPREAQGRPEVRRDGGLKGEWAA